VCCACVAWKIVKESGRFTYSHGGVIGLITGCVMISIYLALVSEKCHIFHVVEYTNEFVMCVSADMTMQVHKLLNGSVRDEVEQVMHLSWAYVNQTVVWFLL
jgi:hypothetical protein